MSVLTTVPLQSVPSRAAGVAVSSGASGVFGPWVQVIAATAQPTAIVGVALSGPSFSQDWWELDLGLGAPAAETSIGTCRFYLSSSAGNSIPSGVTLPVPLGGIPAGVRVAARARVGDAAGGFSTLALLYAENLTSDQATASGQVLSAAPTALTSATLTPSATPWANSAWVQLIASAPMDVGLLGLVHNVVATSIVAGLEFDLGIGAAGAETVLTTLRDADTGTGRMMQTWLPGIYPLLAGTRVAVRLRKADTSTVAYPIALIYYTAVSPAGPPPPVLAGELDRRTLTTATGALNATWTGSTSGNWTAGLVALKKT